MQLKRRSKLITFRNYFTCSFISSHLFTGHLADTAVNGTQVFAVWWRKQAPRLINFHENCGLTSCVCWSMAEDLYWYTLTQTQTHFECYIVMKRISSIYLDCAHAAGSSLSSLTTGFHSFFVINCVPCCLPIRSTFLLVCWYCCWPLEQMTAAVWVSWRQSIHRLIGGCLEKCSNSRFVSFLWFGREWLVDSFTSLPRQL